MKAFLVRVDAVWEGEIVGVVTGDSPEEAAKKLRLDWCTKPCLDIAGYQAGGGHIHIDVLLRLSQDYNRYIAEGKIPCFDVDVSWVVYDKSYRPIVWLEEIALVE